jgi:hypothetical protein
MKMFDDYFKLQADIHDFFGYAENWRVIPLEDSRECYWYIPEDENVVRFADNRVELKTNDDYYEDAIYKQRFLTKYVYRTDTHTLISVDTHTDGNKFLRIFDNNKEIK